MKPSRCTLEISGDDGAVRTLEFEYTGYALSGDDEPGWSFYGIDSRAHERLLAVELPPRARITVRTAMAENTIPVERCFEPGAITEDPYGGLQIIEAG